MQGVTSRRKQVRNSRTSNSQQTHSSGSQKNIIMVLENLAKQNQRRHR
eukprot:UN20123